MTPRALQTLYKVLDDWFPGAGAHEPGAALERRAADAARRPAGARRERRSTASGSTWATAPAAGRWPAARPVRWPTDGGPRAGRSTSKAWGSSACADTLRGTTRRIHATHRRPHRPDRTRAASTWRTRARIEARSAGRPAAAHADAARRRRGGPAGAGAGAACTPHLGRRRARATTAATGSTRRSTCSARGKQVEVSLARRAQRCRTTRAMRCGVHARPASPSIRRASRRCKRRTWPSTRCWASAPAARPTGAIARGDRAPQRSALPGAGSRPALGAERRHRAAAGAACVRADHTLSLLTLKPGLFTGAGRDQAGTVWLDTLGVDDHAASRPKPGSAGAQTWPRRRAGGTPSTRAASATSPSSAARPA